MAKAKNGNGSKAVAKTQKEEWLGLVKADDLQELVSMNLGGGTVSSFDLDRIQIPTGGSSIWTIPTLEGEEGVKELDGIIIHMTEPRAFWSSGFDESGGGTPPDCQSDDGVTGYGVRQEGETPDGSHSCATCPLAQFGSDSRGRGQACKAQKAVFMLRQDTLLPIVLMLPPTSLGQAKKYFLRLLSHNTPANGVVTRWILEKEQNPDGIKYSKAIPTSVRPLTKDELSAVSKYTAAIKPYLESTRPVQPPQEVVDAVEVVEAEADEPDDTEEE